MEGPSFTAAISNLEISMRQLLEAAKSLVVSSAPSIPPLVAYSSSTRHTSPSPIPPLQAIVSPSGQISLSGGALDPFLSSGPHRREETKSDQATRSAAISPSTQPTPLLSSAPAVAPLCSAPAAGPHSHHPSPLHPLISQTDAFQSWRNGAQQDPSRSFVSAASLDPTFAPQFSHSSAKSVSFRHLNQPRVSDGAARLHSKFHSLHSLTKKGTLVCFRCGDSGHLAKSCHNAIVYFACNRLGHCSHTCRAITMLPTSSRPPLTPEMKAQGSSLPIMRFSCTQSIREHAEILRNGVVINDSF